MENNDEIFAIKRDESNVLWKEYIDWVNKNNNKTHDGTWYIKNDCRFFDYYFSNGECSNTSKGYPIITLEQWYEKYNLDKKTAKNNNKIFGIKGDVSNLLWKEYIDWINQNNHVKNDGRFFDYYFSNGECSNTSKGYPIITLEQWKCLVKYEFGYKVPHDMFNGNIKKGDIYIKCNAVDYVYRPLTNKRGEMTHSLPSEIVCSWKKTILIEPQKGEYIVYGNQVFLIEDVVGKQFHLRDKENQPNQLPRGIYQQASKQQIEDFSKDNLPDIGKYKGVIDRKNRTITYGCQTHSFEEIEKFINMFRVFVDNQEDIDFDNIEDIFKTILTNINPKK